MHQHQRPRPALRLPPPVGRQPRLDHATHQQPHLDHPTKMDRPRPSPQNQRTLQTTPRVTPPPRRTVATGRLRLVMFSDPQSESLDRWVRRYFERVVNDRDVGAVDELVAPDYVGFG